MSITYDLGNTNHLPINVGQAGRGDSSAPEMCICYVYLGAHDRSYQSQLSPPPLLLPIPIAYTPTTLPLNSLPNLQNLLPNPPLPRLQNLPLLDITRLHADVSVPTVIFHIGDFGAGGGGGVPGGDANYSTEREGGVSELR